MLTPHGAQLSSLELLFKSSLPIHSGSLVRRNNWLGVGTYLAALRAIWQVALPGKASGSERFPRTGVLRSL